MVTHPLDKVLFPLFLLFVYPVFLKAHTLPNRNDLSAHVFHGIPMAIKVSSHHSATGNSWLHLPAARNLDASLSLKILSPFSLFFQDCYVSGKRRGDGEGLGFVVFLSFSFFPSCFVVFSYSVWQRRHDVAVTAPALLDHVLLSVSFSDPATEATQEHVCWLMCNCLLSAAVLSEARPFFCRTSVLSFSFFFTLKYRTSWIIASSLLLSQVQQHSVSSLNLPSSVWKPVTITPTGMLLENLHISQLYY